MFNVDKIKYEISTAVRSCVVVVVVVVIILNQLKIKGVKFGINFTKASEWVRVDCS